MSLRPHHSCFALVLALGLTTTAVHSGRIGLSWEPASGASGYRVYYGLSPDQLANVREVGNGTRVVLDGLEECVTWYFAVQAYNAAGSSGLSEAVASWSRPSVASAGPQTVYRQGDQFSLEIVGGSFRPAASVQIDAPGVTVESVDYFSCREMRINGSIAPDGPGRQPALIGRFDLRVTNPEGLQGTRTQAFEVLPDPARFDLSRADPFTADRLDGQDVILLLRRFGTRPGDSAYDPDTDLTGDAWIDGDDLALIAGLMGHCWNGHGWTLAACPPALR